MVICHCNGISDRTIRRVVREGARTRSQVALACAAGGCCGGCAPAIDEILEAELGASPVLLSELALASANR